MSRIKLFLFGPPRILRGDDQIHISLRKSVALLAYLAVTRQPHSREALSTLFWPEVDHRTALGNLRRALYRIRQVLGENILLASRTTTQLNAEADIWVDIGVFQEHSSACLNPSSSGGTLDQFCVLRLQEAEKLYRDDFLAGFNLPDSPAFDEWHFFQAEGLKHTFVRILGQLISFYRARRDWDRAILYAGRQISLDPLDETAQRELMVLYSRSGRQTAAMRQYEESKRLLEQEMGVPPSEETLALYHTIKFERAAATRAARSFRQWPIGETINRPGPPHNLPIQTTPFVGRKQEVEELHRLLVDDPNCRLLTIVGLGGIGKTRLALEAAQRAIRVFSDGVYFIPLGSLDCSDYIVPTIAEQIGLSFFGERPPKQQLLHYLQPRRMLLVMDNLEQLLPDTALIADILEGAPEIKILATSQERLKLKGESIYPLDGLDFPEQGSTEPLLDYGAVQLFIQYARLIYPQLELEARDIPEVARICRLVRGMPLALVLAAGWLEVLSFEEIGDEIASSLDILHSRMQGVPERQQSVRAVFEYSWKRLSEAERRAFMRLSVFPKGFTRHAAQHVAKASLHTLRNLIEKSLVSIRQDARYEIHKMLRQFGGEQLDASGEAIQIRNAHSEYSLNILERSAADLKGRRQLAAVREIEANCDDIRAAWHWALGRKNEAAVGRALESLYLYCDIRGRQREGAEYFETARLRLKPNCAAEASLVYGRVLTHLGVLQSRYLQNCPEVGAVIEEGLEVVRKYADKEEIAFGLLSRAHHAIDTMNDVEAALPYIQRSLRYFEEVGDDFYAANALFLIGHCHAYLNGLDDFIRYSAQSLNLSRSIGDCVNTALTLVSLSLAEFFLGNYASAERYAQEAAVIAVESGIGMPLAQVKTFLGILHLLRGHMEEAATYIESGFSIAREVDFPIPLVYAQASLGALASLEGRYAESLRHVQASKAHPGSPYTAGLVSWVSAMAHCNSGDSVTARQELQAVFALDRRLGAPAIAILALPVVAVILAQEGRPQEAVETLALAYEHPLSFMGWMEHWPALRDLRDGLKAQLGPQSYQSAWSRGKTRDVAEVAEVFRYVPLPVSL